MSQRRDDAKARIQEILDMEGEEVLRQKHARGDFVGPEEKEARFRIQQLDKASDAGRHQATLATSKMTLWVAFGAFVVAVLALLWMVFG